MMLLVLSPYPEKITPVLIESGDAWLATDQKVTPEYLRKHDVSMGISFGYRHILKKPVLEVCPFINLHISCLPWNRGADPNIWSWIDGTPKGVTIHYIDEGIDTGDIIAQREVAMGPDETLATSYDKLQTAIIGLFGETWPALKDGSAPRKPQEGKGSLHYAADRRKIEGLLVKGYDTPVNMLINGCE